MLSFVTVFFIYKTFQGTQSKINYIALGDSVAEGLSPYGEVGYGYPDYISDYLRKNDKLNFYTKGFAKSGYTTEDIKNDIENNKKIEVDNHTINIKESLRESDLVTITIGANNFIKSLSLDNFTTKLDDIKKTKKEIDKIGKEVEDLLITVKKYAKGKIILIGYYNPLPRITTYKNTIDELIKYSNNIYREMCEDLNIEYVDIFDEFDKNIDYLPNPFDIHPNIKGYEAIANKIIKVLK